MSIVDVVKYDGTPDVFAWKYPHQELGTWTQLIVNESQEAVLFKGGIACDVFQAGRHTLSTANIPILNNIINLPFGGKSPFTAEIWFINKTISLDVKWGTSTPIQIQDPKYKVFVPLRSFGQFGIQIDNAKKFLIKLVGTLTQFDKTNIIKYFRGVYLTRVKDAISSYFIHHGISILEVNAYLDEISAHLHEQMQSEFQEYGISLVSFYVNDISVPEDDPAVQKLKSALAKKAEMDILGFNYQQERTFDTLEGAATNPGAMQSGLMGAGLGMGIGMGVGGPIGHQFAGLGQHLNVNETKTCPDCSNTVDKAAIFCSSCGFNFKSKPEPSASNAKKIVCASCSNQLTENSKFCSSCGKKYTPCPSCKADLQEGATKCHVCEAEMVPPCPQCGYALQSQAKFCPDCGYSLKKSCPHCAHELSCDAKFCPDCGNKLS